MANVDIRLGYKNAAWFTANPTLVLLEGQTVHLEQTGTYKIGNGVSQLSALSFLGGSGGAVTAFDVSVDNASFEVIQGTNGQTVFESIDYSLLTARATGYEYGGELTSLGSGVVRIAAGHGSLLDNSIPEAPTYSEVNWAGIDLDLSAANGVYYICALSNGTVTAVLTVPSHEEYRTCIWLHRVSIIGGLFSASSSIVMPIQQGPAQLWDLFRAIGSVKIDLNLSAASTDLTIAVSDGEIYQPGANVFNNPLSPHEVIYATKSPATFRLITANGTQTANRTTLDVGNYDLNNVITAIPGATTRAQIWTVKMFAGGGGNIRIFYGQTFYNSISAAYTALSTGTYNPILPASYNEAITLGWIITSKGATNLADGLQIFVTSNKFGGVGGSIATAGTANTNVSDQRSGTVLSFDRKANYGTIALPETGNITANFTGANLGIVASVIHNHSVEPTFPATFFRYVSSEPYVINKVNIIKCEYFDNTHVYYSMSSIL